MVAVTCLTNNTSASHRSHRLTIKISNRSCQKSQHIIENTSDTNLEMSTENQALVADLCRSLEAKGEVLIPGTGVAIKDG